MPEDEEIEPLAERDMSHDGTVIRRDFLKLGLLVKEGDVRWRLPGGTREEVRV
jgi:hypothetical protein